MEKYEVEDGKLKLLDKFYIDSMFKNQDFVYDTFCYRLSEGYYIGNVEEKIKNSFNKLLYIFLENMINMYYEIHNKKDEIKNDKYIKKGQTILNKKKSIYMLIKFCQVTFHLRIPQIQPNDKDVHIPYCLLGLESFLVLYFVSLGPFFGWL